MLNNDITKPFKEDVLKILKKVEKKSHAYNINLLFTTPRFPDLRVQVSREIKEITIDQDFVNNITDKILVELTLTHINDYVTLYYFRKDLQCRMQLTEIKPDVVSENSPSDGHESLGEMTMNFKACIIQYEDIFEKISVDRLWPEIHEERDETDADRGSYNMTIELIDAKVYLARKKVFNETFKNVTMLDMMRYTVNSFGFNRALLVSPDNDWTYTNFIIPPSYGVESIMNFYQNAEGLGIYKDGIISYLTRWWKDGNQIIWWVCPRYGDPLTKNPIHLYATGDEMYTGLNQNHYREGETWHILITDSVNIHNLSDVGSENAITGINVQCSPSVLDGSRLLKNDDEVEAVSVTSDFVNLPTDPMDMNNMVRVHYIQDSGNQFRSRSVLREPQITTIALKWRHAAPFTFTPGTMVTLHYDHPLGYKQFKGQCEHAIYHFTLDEHQKMEPLFMCTASITLNCDNVVNYEHQKAHA